MIPRGKLDISYSALLKGLFYCLTESGHNNIVRFTGNSVTCLSVRTGLDLALRSLNLPPGSEILISDINIPDMFNIIRAHQLQAIPLSINRDSLNLSAAEVESRIGPATKVILITHLFGAITETAALIKLAKQHNLIVIEDCAQAFNGTYTGNPKSDVVMFSFGFIKTNTSLTGALLYINNSQLYEKMALLNALLPVQNPKAYLKKIWKGFAVKLITGRWLYTILYRLSGWLGRDFDEVLAGFTRGFPGADVLGKIRFRPCRANVRLMENRLATFRKAGIDKRTALANEILKVVPESMKTGHLATLHTHWVLPVRTKEPGQLITNLRSLGIDATAKASSLLKLNGNTEDTGGLDLDELVYLPVHPATVAGIKLALKKASSKPILPDP